MEKYAQIYEIKSYQCDRSRRLRLVCLFNLLQDMADTHANLINVGYNFCIQKNVGWVGSNYHVKINRLPEWGEKITIKTWPSLAKRISAIRDFEILDERGEYIIKASSQWVLIDLKRLRPVIIDNYMRYDKINERGIQTDFSAIILPQETPNQKNITVRYDDFDLNQHVNNSIYPVWAIDSLPESFRHHKTIQEIKVAFKKSITQEDEVNVEFFIQNLYTIHRITSTDKSKEFARIEVLWADNQ